MAEEAKEAEQADQPAEQAERDSAIRAMLLTAESLLVSKSTGHSETVLHYAEAVFQCMAKMMSRGAFCNAHRGGVSLRRLRKSESQTQKFWYIIKIDFHRF